MTQNGMLGTSKKMLACPHLVMLSEASMLDSLLALGKNVRYRTSPMKDTLNLLTY
jgi:hypothetical protein